MDIEIALTHTQFRQLLTAFAKQHSDRRPVQIIHHVRQVVENHQAVLKNSLRVACVRWKPTEAEVAALEAEIRTLAEALVEPDALTIQEVASRANSFAVANGAMNLRGARQEYGRKLKTLRLK